MNPKAAVLPELLGAFLTKAVIVTALKESILFVLDSFAQTGGEKAAFKTRLWSYLSHTHCEMFT